MTTWTRQEHAHGCGPACVAMVVGISYGEACDEIEASPAHGSGRNWEINGTNHMALDHVLQQHDFWRQRIYRAWQPNQEKWPPEPWAPIHICQVQQPSRNAHFVVMLADGTVLDPLHDGPPHGLGVYADVLNVCGLIKP